MKQKTEECPLMINCKNLYKNCEMPIGCKTFPNCDFFKNSLDEYCKRISKFKGFRNKIQIPQCDICKYPVLCDKSGHLKAMRKKSQIPIKTTTDIKRQNDKETKEMVKKLKEKGFEFK